MENDNGEGSRGSSEQGSGPFLTDAIKKIVTAGVSAAFMTEESIRSFVSELRLPKETLHLLLQGAAKSKEEITNRVGREVVNIISKIDFVKEASRFVEEHKFRVTAEIEVLRREPGNGEGVEAGPSVNLASSVQVEVSERTQKKKS